MRLNLRLPLLILTCGSGLLSAQEKPIPTKPLIPLAVGNSWTYENKTALPDGTFEADDETRETVKGVFETDAGTFYYLDSPDFAIWLRNTPAGNEDALFEVDTETFRLKISGKPTLYYRYPVKKGTTYDIQYSEDDQAYLTMKVSEVDLPVKTPAGSFRCLKYELYAKESETLDVVEYVCPSVGLVRSEVYEDGKLTSVGLLKSYHISPQSE